MLQCFRERSHASAWGCQVHCRQDYLIAAQAPGDSALPDVPAPLQVSCWGHLGRRCRQQPRGAHDPAAAHDAGAAGNLEMASAAALAAREARS